MPRPLVLALLLAIGPATAIAQNALPFEAARSLLHQRSDKLRIDAAEVERRRLESEASSALDGPKLILNATQVWGSKEVELGPVNVPSISLGPITTPALSLGPFNIKDDLSGPRSSLITTWPLYTGGLITAKRMALAAAVDEARADRERTTDELDNQLAQRYFGVQLMRSVEKLRAGTLAQQDAELVRAQRFEQQGLISKLERMSVQVARDDAARELIKAQTDREIAEIQLARLLRETRLPPLATPLFVRNTALVPLTRWQAIALESNPALNGIAAKRSQAEQGVAAANAAWKPQVFAFGQYNMVRRYLTLPEPDWIAGVGVNITLWDSEDRRSRVLAAETLVEKADAARSEATNEIATVVEVAWRRSEQAREQYRLTASGVELAAENLRLRQRSFAEGLSTALDVNEARNSLLKAEIGRRVAAYEFVVAYAALHAVAGRMTDFAAQARGKDIMVEP
ncbi:MAG: TolC family protein [Burkholderiaceae bacterium]